MSNQRASGMSKDETAITSNLRLNWNTAIDFAQRQIQELNKRKHPPKRKIRRLEWAIEVFAENRDQGEPLPEVETKCGSMPCITGYETDKVR